MRKGAPHHGNVHRLRKHRCGPQRADRSPVLPAFAPGSLLSAPNLSGMLPRHLASAAADGDAAASDTGRAALTAGARENGAHGYRSGRYAIER